jgi:hypothetical protein
LFGSTASRAQSGAKDGFWSVFSGASSINQAGFVLKPKNKLNAEKIGGKRWSEK